MRKLNYNLNELGEVKRQNGEVFVKLHADLAPNVFEGKKGNYLNHVVWEDKRGYGESVQVQHTKEQRESGVSPRYAGNIQSFDQAQSGTSSANNAVATDNDPFGGDSPF